MILRNLKSYFKFLSKNKLYSFVSIFGFSVSLMFVIVLSLYTKQELSVDSFHDKKDRIYLMTHDRTASFSNPSAELVKDLCPEVEAYCRVYSSPMDIGSKREEKFRAEGILADSTFFDVFSFKLIEGTPSQVLVSQRSVVVTQSFANKLFAKQNPIGKIITINNEEHIVTGIMEEIPQNSQFPQCDFVASYSSIALFMGESHLNSDSNFAFTIYFLEKEGANLSAKTALLLDEFNERLWFYKNGFTDNLEFVKLQDVYFDINPAWTFQFKTNDKKLISIYAVIAILILIVATLNYINMTVAQAGFRGKEAAIKKLLGGSKKSIVFQLLSESLIMTCFTFLIGLVLIFIFKPFFNEVLSTNIGLIEQLTPSIVLVSILFILLISLLSGLIPALVISDFNPLEVVKGAFARKIKTTYSKVLITFQYIVAITLLICSFFIKQQSDFLLNHDLGYNHDRVFVITNSLDTTQLEGFRSNLLSISGVDKVSYSKGTPSHGANQPSFEIDGEQYTFLEIAVDPYFFEIYGIDVEKTGIIATDRTFWVNRNIYNALITDKNDLTVKFGSSTNMRQIAGIISDIHIESLRNQSQYVELRKLRKGEKPWQISVKINDGADMFATADQIKREYTAYSGGEYADGEFIDSIIQKWYLKEQKLSKILTAFTLLTIIISVMGVFAMSLYMIKQKEREIGVRKVNGATESQVLLMLNKDSLLRVLIAFVIACPIAYYAVAKWLEDFSYRMSLNWWTFALAGAIIALLTLASVSYMTWKAARANPVKSLKSE